MVRDDKVRRFDEFVCIDELKANARSKALIYEVAKYASIHFRLTKKRRVRMGGFEFLWSKRVSPDLFIFRIRKYWFNKPILRAGFFVDGMTYISKLFTTDTVWLGRLRDAISEYRLRLAVLVPNEHEKLLRYREQIEKAMEVKTNAT